MSLSLFRTMPPLFFFEAYGRIVVLPPSSLYSSKAVWLASANKVWVDDATSFWKLHHISFSLLQMLTTFFIVLLLHRMRNMQSGISNQLKTYMESHWKINLCCLCVGGCLLWQHNLAFLNWYKNKWGSLFSIVFPIV